MPSKFTAITLMLCGGLAFANPALAADSASDPMSAEKRERAAEILQQMLPLDIADGMASKEIDDSNFGDEMSRLSFENAYMQLWTRPGLSLKQRSLVTISMLIALGNEDELAVHFAAGLRNGLTVEEIEEVIYHSSAYAGFPRAANALKIAKQAIGKEKSGQ